MGRCCDTRGTEEVDKLLREGKQVAVTVAEEQELLSPLACEERRAESGHLTAEWSRDLDAMGAPAE